MARPSPRLPPVISARLPSRRKLSRTLMDEFLDCFAACGVAVCLGHRNEGLRLRILLLSAVVLQYDGRGSASRGAGDAVGPHAGPDAGPRRRADCTACRRPAK